MSVHRLALVALAAVPAHAADYPARVARILKATPLIDGHNDWAEVLREREGEGRWTIQAALEESVPVPVISSALFARFESRDPYDFSARFCAALRNQFGGHGIRKAMLRELDESGQTHPPRP